MSIFRVADLMEFLMLLGKDVYRVSGRGQHGRHPYLSRHLGRQTQSCLHCGGECSPIFPAGHPSDRPLHLNLPETKKQTSSKNTI